MTRRLLVPIEDAEAAAIAQMQKRFPHLSDTAAIRTIMAEWMQDNQKRDDRTIADLFLAIIEAFNRVEQRLGTLEDEKATFDVEELET